MEHSGRITLPRSQRRYRISLTPLADAMFQLLIFFMLSSNITPYSLLTLRSGSAAQPGQEPGLSEAAPAPVGTDAAIWMIGKGEIVASGVRFGMDSLSELADALAGSGHAQVVLVLRPDAEVQDLSSVLEGLGARGITDIRLANGG